MRTGVDKSNDTQKWIAFNQAVGSRASAMEGLVPQQLYSTATAPAESISAVKALALANAQGQKIWTITKTNLATALASVQLPASVETDISNAVNAGKVVTTQSQPVSYVGGNFTGYLVIDPATGAGGYLLGNGTNGGHVKIDSETLGSLFWSSFGKLGGAFGELVSGLKFAYDQLKAFFNLDKNCPTGKAIIGIISITFFTIGLLLLTPFFAFFGIIAAIIYDLLVGALSAFFDYKWLESCKKN
jgi:hypothetical protein